jgi:hypothetical protein
MNAFILLRCIKITVHNPPFILYPETGEVEPGFEAVLAGGVVWGRIFSI